MGSAGPDRFYSVGIAEADAVGIAAGIASFGGPVIFTAYGVFATEKPFEQIRNCLCYPNLNVKIVATHGGISVGEDGATHQAVEDIAIMRALPNMKVLVAGGPGRGAGRGVRRAANARAGIRPARPGVGAPLHLEPEAVDFRVGKGEVLRDGSDVTLAAVGVMVERALRAAELLEAEASRRR